jgi:hypothetical protein
MTKLEALEGSVKKWEDICDDKEDLIMAVNRCPLCDFSVKSRCEDCPLVEIKQGCRQKKSIWWQLDDLLDAVNAPNYNLFSHAPEHIRSLCSEMRDILRELRDEEKELLK